MTEQNRLAVGRRLRRLLMAALAYGAVLLDFHGDATRYFTYFTVLTNLGIGTWFLGASLDRRWERASGIRLSLTVYGLATLLIYWIFLAPSHHPQGPAILANGILHLVVPVGMAWEDLLVPWPDFRTNPLQSLIFPAVYTGFTLIRGSATGWYPYYFFNIRNWNGSWAELAAFLGLLLAVFTALAFGWRLAVRRRLLAGPKTG